MFATATASLAHPHAGAYQRIGVETGVAAATPHQLVLMLFDGFDESLVQAVGAIRSRQVDQKCRAIARATRIVDEGLRASLNMTQGGTLAADLHTLYAYISGRLLHAQLTNDVAALDECRRLMQPLREAWVSIAPAP